MLTLIGLYKRPVSNAHGEASFWAPDQWGPTYVRRAIKGADRWISQPWHYILLTDTPSVLCGVETWGLASDHTVEAVPLIEYGKGLGLGYWSKVQMLRPDLGASKRCYMDLDNVLTGPFDEFVNINPAPFMCLDDRVYPRLANGSTTLFLPEAEAIQAIWQEYDRDPAKIEKEFSTWGTPPVMWSDQAFYPNRLRRMGLRVPYAQDYAKPGSILNQKVEMGPKADTSNCRLVFGSDTYKPHTSEHPFIREHWID